MPKLITIFKDNRRICNEFEINESWFQFGACCRYGSSSKHCRCEFPRLVRSGVWVLFVFIGKMRQLQRYLKRGGRNLKGGKQSAHAYTSQQHQIQRDSDSVCKMEKEINTDVSSGGPPYQKVFQRLSLSILCQDMPLWLDIFCSWRTKWYYRWESFAFNVGPV